MQNAENYGARCLFPNSQAITTVDMALANANTLAYTTRENTTPELLPPVFDSLGRTKVTVLSIMFVISLAANSLALVRIVRRHWQRMKAASQRPLSSVELVIGHLVVADLLVTFFCNVAESVWAVTVEWLAGDVACKLVKYCQVLVHN